MKYILLAVLVFNGTPALAASSLALLKESVLWLEGDSTLHRFSSTSTAITADMNMAASPGTFYDSLKNGELQKFRLRVPVATLKSGKNQLDKNMREALKAQEHPEILFDLKQYQMKPQPGASREILISAKGILTVAGTSKEITLEGRGGPENGATRVTGSYELLMTDYGIKPPTMMMGTLKTYDKVVVRYVLYFAFDTK